MILIISTQIYHEEKMNYKKYDRQLSEHLAFVKLNKLNVFNLK